MKMGEMKMILTYIIHKPSALSQSFLLKSAPSTLKEDIHWNPERRPNPLNSNSSFHPLYDDQNIKRPRDNYEESQKLKGNEDINKIVSSIKGKELIMSIKTLY